MSGASKANQRQSRNHKLYYSLQKDKTLVNKIITMARHIAVFNDKRAMDRLRQRPEIDKKRAFQKTTSPRIKEVITNSYA